VSQKEVCPIDREPGDDRPTANEVPQEFRAEGSLIEGNRRISVADRQHGRNLSFHRITPDTENRKYSNSSAIGQSNGPATAGSLTVRSRDGDFIAVRLG
jgi:hypothetical protein